MNVGSVNSSAATQISQRTAEAAETKKAGPDHDGDSDDRSAASVKAAPAASVNTNGQTVGQVINVAV